MIHQIKIALLICCFSMVQGQGTNGDILTGKGGKEAIC